MMPALWDLTGRTALVTGAGSSTGIGFAAARALADLGARVAITSTTDRIHERAEQLTASGCVARGFIADLTNVDQTRLLLEDVHAWVHSIDNGVLGAGIDILVNNAGMTSVTTPGVDEAGLVGEIDLGGWRDALARNLDSAFLLSQSVLPGMVASGWGRVVMVASVTGPIMAMRGEIAYAAAKAGMVGLTRALAVDHAADGVTVNAVAPGWIATGSQTEHEAEQGRRTPMRRSGTPEEIAAAIAWLATPAAGYTTGQCLVVDGGNGIAEERA